MSIFLDASYFLALISERDVHHKKAVALAGKIEAGEYGEPFTSDHILDEAISVAMRKYGKDEAIILGKQILNSVTILPADYHIIELAWQVFRETKLGLSFTDCTSLVFIKIAAAVVLATFDKEFEKVKGLKI